MHESNTLFSDNFTVKSVGDKIFDRVSRFSCSSEAYEMEMVIDINTDIYEINVADSFALVLASSLYLNDDEEDRGHSLLEEYEYCMHGTIFKRSEGGNNHATLYISFGGLLMQLKGESNYVSRLHLDSQVYLLMRKRN
eukprot:TRINITY_DN1919_c0_g1_i1.p1 TRINITY_DN1919_c0_g1~~TRINITY_DN1919_c0_g1_i1.p1  ORF type:complete len:138 (-),score=15.86 TRINITY_DN1919_c0_g1_i1:27-440(-)